MRSTLSLPSEIYCASLCQWYVQLLWLLMGTQSKNIFSPFRVHSLIILITSSFKIMLLRSSVSLFIFGPVHLLFTEMWKGLEDPVLGRGSGVWRNHKICWRCLLEHLQSKITLTIKKRVPKIHQGLYFLIFIGISWKEEKSIFI